MVTRDASGLRADSRGVEASRRPWPGALREPRGVQAAGRNPRGMGVALAPQAPPRGDRTRLHLVGAARDGVVDRRAVRRGVDLLRAGLVPALCDRSGHQRGRPHLLHRVDLLHDRVLPAVLRGGDHAHRARSGGPPRSPLAPAGPAPSGRLVGGDHPVRRHPVVQPDDPRARWSSGWGRRRATIRCGGPTPSGRCASWSRAGWPGPRSATGPSPGDRVGSRGGSPC